jgi:hypothetical protein
MESPVASAPKYVGCLLEEEGVPTHIFRAYYTNVGVFEMLGNRCEIVPLAEEIIRIHDALIVGDKNGGRLRQASENP